MKEQTALDELIDYFIKCKEIDVDMPNDTVIRLLRYKKAKERQQIEEAYKSGFGNNLFQLEIDADSSTKYYEEKYKN